MKPHVKPLRDRGLGHRAVLMARIRDKAVADYGSCYVVGCREAAQLGGLCRKHRQQLRAHGRSVGGSLPGPLVTRARRSALLWIEAHRGETAVALALAGVERLLVEAGPRRDPKELSRTGVYAKAKAPLSRLRADGANPVLLLAAVVGVALAHELEGRPGGDRGEFLRVQVGKVLMRLAGGRVRRWPGWIERADVTRIDEYGRRITREVVTAVPERVIRQFQRSEGLPVRQLGAWALEAALGLVHPVHGRLDEAVAAHRAGPVVKEHGLRSVPDGRAVRRRPKVAVE